MQGYNRVIFGGNLGADPELKYTQSGQAVLRLRVASNDSYVDKNGEKHDRTEWATAVIWGKRGEALNKLLKKGSPVLLEGKLQSRSWEADDGSKRYATEINVSDVKLLGDSGKSQGGGRGRQSSEGDGGYDDQFGDDDIPF